MRASRRGFLGGLAASLVWASSALSQVCSACITYIDDLGVTSWIDDNGITCWTADLV